jgi:tetratricopeptide (TPR) repeat protein
VKYADRAFALQDRMSEPERLEMLAGYYCGGSRRDLANCVRYFLELGERYPLWPIALQNRATAMDEYLYEHARAESTFARAIQTLPDEPWSYTHIVRPQIALGRFDAAHRSVARARAKAAVGSFMDYDLDQLDAIILYNEGRIDSALSTAMASTRREAGAARLSTLLSVYSLTGRRAEFWSRLALGRRVDAGRGVPDLVETDSVWAAVLAVNGYAEDPARTLKRLDALFTAEAMSKLPTRMLLTLARVYAKGAELDGAKRVLRVYDRDVADRRRPREDPRFRRRLEGFVALAEGKGVQALAIFREVNTPPYLFCPICMDPDMAQAFELANLPDSALAAYEHSANTPYWNRPFVDGELPMTLRRIGELYEARGNRAEALKYYHRFVDLWKNADPPLQPKVAEVKRRMTALRTDGVSSQINTSASASSIKK